MVVTVLIGINGLTHILLSLASRATDLTANFFESGAMSTPTKSPNPTVLSQGGLISTQ